MRFLHRHFVPSRENAFRPHLLRRGYLTLFLALALGAEALLVGSLIAREAGNSFLAAVIQSEIISLTNTARADGKLRVLAESQTLTRAAQAKAADMATKGYFAHDGPDGKKPWAWIAEAGYRYRYAGENLAVRFIDSKDVHQGWMASPTHRANIEKGVYTEIGVGIAQGLYQGEPATYVVQYFGTPAAAAAATPAPPRAALPAPTTTAAVLGVEAAPEPTSTLAAASVQAPTQASFSDSLARQLSRFAADPRANTAILLGVIALILCVALAFAFFHHIQIQAGDMLAPGAAVAAVVIALIAINTSVLGPTIPLIEQTAAAVAAEGTTALQENP